HQVRLRAGRILGEIEQTRSSERDGLGEADFAEVGGREPALHFDGSAGPQTRMQANAALAGRKIQFLRPERLAFGGELDFRFRWARSAHNEVDGEALAREYCTGRGDGFESKERFRATIQGERVYGHTLLLRLPCGPCGAAAILLAVGNEHDA